MITWGLVGNSHDASLAVFKDDELVWAALAKEFSGIPHDPHLNPALIGHARYQYGEPDQIVWYEKPLLKTLRQFRAGQGWLLKENNIKQYLADRGIVNIPIKYSKHHTSHAAYAYYTQPQDDCAIICLDSIGEFESLTIWHAKDNKLRKIFSQGYPHSLGLFYSAMTQRVGLVPQRDEHLVVEMARKGDATRFLDIMREEIIDVSHRRQPGPHVRMRENLHRGCMWWRPELNTPQDLADIAAATQLLFQYSVYTLSTYAKRRTRAKHLALAGGGALNRKAIRTIRSHWDSIWVPPNPGDPGSCIGAVLAQKQIKIESVDKAWYKKV